MSSASLGGSSPARLEATRIELVMHSPSLAIVELVGEHDLAQRELLTEAIETAAARRRHVLVDLSRCLFFDSTVIGVLLLEQDRVTADGGRFGLVIPPDAPHAARVVETMQLTDILAIYESRDEAFRTFEHVTRVRDARARFGDVDAYRAECSCGWIGDLRSGVLAMRHANADSVHHHESLIAVLPRQSRLV